MNDHPQWIIKYGYRNRNPKIVRWHDHSEIAQVTSETDAALIAAAPDLLAALKDCYAELNQLAFLQGDKLAKITLDKARAAISKAEA